MMKTPILQKLTDKPRLTLKVNQHKNILDGIILKEHIDKVILQQLINSNLLKEQFNNKIAGCIYHNEKKQLEKFLTINNNGIVEITYKKWNNNPYGRCDPQNGLGLYPIRREIRHTLAEEWGVDIDIENCHPEMVLQLCRENGYNSSVLADYINNRESYLKQVSEAYGCSRDEAKNYFLITLYCGGFKRWITESNINYNNCIDEVKGGITKTNEIDEDGNPVLKYEFKSLSIMENYKSSLRQIQDAIYKSNPEIREIAEQIKQEQNKFETYNPIGTVCSYVLQEYEVRVLECVYMYCVDKQYINNRVCSLCADGIILERKYYKSILLKELSEEVYNKIGFRFNFIEKPMTKSYSQDILLKSIDFKLENKSLSDSLLADCFNILYGNIFLKNNGTVYKYNNYYWTELDSKNSELHNFMDTEFYNYFMCDFDKKLNICYTELKELYTKYGVDMGTDFIINILTEVDIFKKQRQAENMKKLVNKIEDGNKTPAPKPKPEPVKKSKSKSKSKKTEPKLKTKTKKELDAETAVKEAETITATAILDAADFKNKKYNIFDKIEFIQAKQTDIHKRLKTIVFRKNILEDILNKIIRNYISFDTDPFLFSFNNAIFDLNEDSFIKPCYNQYIKTTTGYDYEKYYPKSKIEGLNNLICSIQPSKDIRDFYLFILATGLCGLQLEYLFIATGVGGNGKSLINSLFKATVGGYGYKLGMHVLMNKSSGGANPEVANMANKRFVLVQEPEGTVCVATVKELTGESTLNARGLYEKNCEKILRLSLLMECNGLPRLNEVGNAIERRIRAVPFKQIFVSETVYNQADENEKKGMGIINTYYKTDKYQQETRQALFEILRPYFVMFKNNNYKLMDAPKECADITREYLATSDDIYDWFKTLYEAVETKVDEEIIFIDDIYNQFINSSIWELMTKKDKLKYNKKHFLEKVEQNIFLKKYYKLRDTTYNKNRYKKSFIIGHRLIQEDDFLNETEFQGENTGCLLDITKF